MLPHSLTFDDKLNIAAQRIYEETYGLSVVDLLIMEDLSLDGISGGVSGITNKTIYTWNMIYSQEAMKNHVHMKVYG